MTATAVSLVRHELALIGVGTLAVADIACR
ncbi:Ms4533A family Cys-rich leader peptide [Aldersonia sp. NBC_00410]|nr:Ms4533A family Cys-rich leader peptide [Aldersonia sp. NBC_00410]